MHTPKSIHMEVIDRILRYFKKTPGKGILMKKNSLMIYVAIPMQIGPETLIKNPQPAIVHLYAGI
jgi:hypothetical protein